MAVISSLVSADRIGWDNKATWRCDIHLQQFSAGLRFDVEYCDKFPVKSNRWTTSTTTSYLHTEFGLSDQLRYGDHRTQGLRKRGRRCPAVSSASKKDSRTVVAGSRAARRCCACNRGRSRPGSRRCVCTPSAAAVIVIVPVFCSMASRVAETATSVRVQLLENPCSEDRQPRTTPWSDCAIDTSNFSEPIGAKRFMRPFRRYGTIVIDRRQKARA